MKLTSLNPRDTALLSQAVSLARKGLFTTKPNPRVGCVIYQGETLVGEGWHQRAGESHAEIHALQQAGEQARGGEVFVSLEPCAHQGRTGPCGQALIDAGVRRIVVAMTDPNPKVCGKGLALLEQAGIEVVLSEDDLGARDLNAGFCQRMEHGRPLVRIKLGATMDGRTAAYDGTSQWITSEAARADVHELRACSCAVVTGIGTIRNDNPRLNARVAGDVVQPLRVVLDGNGQMPLTARLFSEPGHILVVTAKDTEDASYDFDDRTEQICLGGKGSRIDLAAVLATLAARSCNEVLVEAGAVVAGAFLSAGLVDEVWVYQSPDVLGTAGHGMFVIRGIRTLEERVRLELSDVTRIGRDLRLIYRPADPQ